MFWLSIIDINPLFGPNSHNKNFAEISHLLRNLLIFPGPHFQIPSKNARQPVATNFKLPSYGGILKKPQSLADLEAAARPTQHQPVAIKWLNDRSPYRTDSNPIYEDTGLTKYNDVRHLPYVLQQLNGHIQASNSGSTTQIDQTRFKSPPVIIPLGMGKISIIFLYLVILKHFGNT